MHLEENFRVGRVGWDTSRWGKGHMAIRQHQQQLLHEAESWYDDGSAVCASLCWLCHHHVTDADVATCHFFYPPLPLMLLSGEDQGGVVKQAGVLIVQFSLNSASVSSHYSSSPNPPFPAARP